MPRQPIKLTCTPANPANPAEELCLLMPGQLESHLSWVAESECRPTVNLPPDVARRWRRAHARYEELSITQAGMADHPDIQALPKPMQRHADTLARIPAFVRTFDTVPVTFGMVELDKLVVSQACLTQAAVKQICDAHAPRPSLLSLARLCLPHQPARSEFKLVYRDDSEFIFTAAAHDMRFLGATLLAPTACASLNLPGHAQGAVALGLGASCNVLDVVRWRDRLVLNNGHHRAYALRAMGLTYAPCVIQVCGSADDMALAASTELAQHSDLYFDAPRPPLLRDFDDPVLTHRVRTHRLQRQVRVTFKVESRLLACA